MRALILSFLVLTSCAQTPMTAQQRYAVLASFSEPSPFIIPIMPPDPVYSSSMPANLGSFEPNYAAQIREPPAPSPARRILDCGQTSTCAGAFDLRYPQ